MPLHPSIVAGACVARTQPPSPGRRATLLAAGGAAAGLLAPRAGTAHRPSGIGTAAEDWADFRRRFLAPEGRILDTGNRNISHSEGQAYGLLAALRADDRGSFSRILNWTLGQLKRREDELHAWRFQPDMQPPVTDPNNASDGDLLIAWATLDAARRWGLPELRRRGVLVARDLARRCVRRVGERTVLLPGAYGFEARGRVVLNLSYYVFPALLDLTEETGDPTWGRVAQDGLQLLREARFGRWSLPPDWLELREDGQIFVAANWPPRFSFDAVRIPLNLAWAGLAREPAGRAAVAFWTGPDPRKVPAWADLRTGQMAPFPASPGVVAVARLAAAALEGRGDPSAMPRVAGAPDYYAAALALLARAAWRERGLG